MATPEWMHLGPSTRHKEQRRTDERMTSNENRKQSPVCYQGVFHNDRSANNSGDVTPVSLRPPMPGGFLNLPRYVPKYTINSRLQQNGLFPPPSSSSSVDAEHIRNQKRRNRGNSGNDSGGNVPVYKETQEKVYSNVDQTYVNHDQTSSPGKTSSSAPHRNHGAKDKPGKRRNRNSGKRSDPGKRNDRCCRCSCRPRRRCGGCTAECSPLIRGVVCAVVVVVVVAAILAAIALSLYFAYYEQLGDETPIVANFTIQGVEFPAYLLNLGDPQTDNVTGALCKAFETTLQDLDGVKAKVFSCSAVEYKNGSITGIFNLDVRHQRDTFMRTPNAFLSAVRDKLRADFGHRSDGQFYSAISRSFDATSGFEIRLNNVDRSYISTPETAAKATVGMTTVATSASVAASGFGSTLTNSSAPVTTISASVSRSNANTSLGNRMTTSVVATTTGRPTSNRVTTLSSTAVTSRTSVRSSSGRQGPTSRPTISVPLGMSTGRKAGTTTV